MYSPRVTVVVFTVFSFLIYFLPSEPFLVRFLTRDKDLSEDEITRDIFPLWTYGEFFFLVLLVLIGELLHIVPLLVGGILAQIGTLLILILSEDYLLLMLEQLSNAFYATACQLLFFSYVYYCIPEDRYHQVSSAVRSSSLLGTVFSSLFGQFLLSVVEAPLSVLFIMSLIFMVLALLVAFTLPTPPINRLPGRSWARLLFISPKAVENEDFSDEEGDAIVTDECVPESLSNEIPKGRVHNMVRQIWTGVSPLLSDVWASISSPDVVHFSAWMWVALAIHQLVLTYWQNLFEEADPNVDIFGYVFAIAYVCAACAAFISISFGAITRKIGDCLLIAASVYCGFCLMAMNLCHSHVYCTAGAFVMYHCSFEFVYPIAASQLALRMGTMRFASVFLLNSAISLICQSILQGMLSAFSVHIFDMFLIFGGVSFILAICLTGTGFWRLVREVRLAYADSSEETLPLVADSAMKAKIESVE